MDSYVYIQHSSLMNCQILSLMSQTCKYVDIPLQHVNSDILKQMNRRDDRSDIERLLKKIRNAYTYYIAYIYHRWLPGETDEQFENFATFVKEIKFDNMGVFTQEEGTPGKCHEDQVPEEIKKNVTTFLCLFKLLFLKRIIATQKVPLIMRWLKKSKKAIIHCLTARSFEISSSYVDGNMYIEDCGEDIKPK